MISPTQKATHNTHKGGTSMPPAGFEPEIPESQRPQTHVLYLAVTGIGSINPQTALHRPTVANIIIKVRLLSTKHHTRKWSLSRVGCFTANTDRQVPHWIEVELNPLPGLALRRRKISFLVVWNRNQALNHPSLLHVYQ
jgi:hypothetical protein